MVTSIDLFDYHLPPENIAQSPTEPRDHCKLLVMDRTTGALEHKIFYQIVDELRAGDVLVMNDSKVFKARLHGANNLEIFLLRGEGRIWECLLKPGKRVKVGDVISVGDLQAKVIEKRDDGVVVLEFDRSREEVIAFADDYGSIPLPPYIETTTQTLDQYQTVYAREVGSVAAPTAGLHFTPESLEAIRAKGVEVHYITLHVGLGTFRPVKSATLEEHQMHAEFVEITPATSEAIKRAKKEGRRVIAVGTTTVRALEGAASSPPFMEGLGEAYLPETGYSGDLNIFITPGYKFKIVDALITNFHLPKSTLIVLISAFAGLPSVASAKEGRENVLAAYQEAIEKNYRFYSFGDAMFIR